jgi:hypothetical protein
MASREPALTCDLNAMLCASAFDIAAMAAAFQVTLALAESAIIVVIVLLSVVLCKRAACHLEHVFELSVIVARKMKIKKAHYSMHCKHLIQAY